MKAEKSTCYNCAKQGHYARTCYNGKVDDIEKSSGAHDKQNNNKCFKGKAGSKGAAGCKLCSEHKTTSHDDAGCFEQGASLLP